MRRLDQVLVLREGNGNRRSFQFRNKHWYVYSFAISVMLLIGATMIQDMNRVHFKEILVPALYIVSCLFIYASFYSYFTTIVLDIDGNAKVIRRSKSNRFIWFVNTDRTMDFASYSDVRLWRPGRSSFFVTVLQMKDQQETLLGTGESGTLDITRARKIAHDIAALMEIPFIEESTVC